MAELKQCPKLVGREPCLLYDAMKGSTLERFAGVHGNGRRPAWVVAVDKAVMAAGCPYDLEPGAL